MRVHLFSGANLLACGDAPLNLFDLGPVLNRHRLESLVNLFARILTLNLQSCSQTRQEHLGFIQLHRAFTQARPESLVLLMDRISTLLFSV
jgi:hypothetical protein